jgi:hypothetical protein
MLKTEFLDALNIYKLTNDKINTIANIKRNFSQIAYNYLRHNSDFDYVIQESFLDPNQTNISTSTVKILNGKISNGIWYSTTFSMPVNVRDFKYLIYPGVGITLYVNSQLYDHEEIDRAYQLPAATTNVNIQINSTQENYMFFIMIFKES